MDLETPHFQTNQFANHEPSGRAIWTILDLPKGKLVIQLGPPILLLDVHPPCTSGN